MSVLLSEIVSSVRHNYNANEVTGESLDAFIQKELYLQSEETNAQKKEPIVIRDDSGHLFWRTIVFQTLDDPDFSPLAFWWGVLILLIILLASVVFCLETLPQFWEKDNETLFYLELSVIVVFSFDYFTRLATVETSRLQYAKQWLNIIDLLSILPFYVEMLLKLLNIESTISEFGVIRIVRLTRVFRMLKLTKHSGSFKNVGRAMKMSLDIVFLLCFLFTLTVIFFGSVVYYAEQSQSTFYRLEGQDSGVWYYNTNSTGYECSVLERNENNEIIRLSPSCQRSAFQSIPESLWWGVVTATTVGYGDMVPLTTLGRLATTVLALLSLIVIALPVSIIGSNFESIWFEAQNEKQHQSIGAMALRQTSAVPLRKLSRHLTRVAHSHLADYSVTITPLLTRIRDCQNDMRVVASLMTAPPPPAPPQDRPQ